MPEVEPLPDGGVRIAFDAIERRIMRQVTGELRTILTTDASPDDPVTERLFPAAYETPEDDANYRQMVGDDLTKAKLKALDSVAGAVADDAPPSVDLADEDLHTWLACLTDLRLAIGTRLDVDEDRMAADVDPSQPDAQALTVLHWLGWVQEGILRAAGANP